MLWCQRVKDIGLFNHKLKSALKCTVWCSARPSQTDGQTDKRANIMTMKARRFVLTNASRAKTVLKFRDSPMMHDEHHNFLGHSKSATRKWCINVNRSRFVRKKHAFNTHHKSSRLSHLISGTRCGRLSTEPPYMYRINVFLCHQTQLVEMCLIHFFNAMIVYQHVCMCMHCSIAQVGVIAVR